MGESTRIAQQMAALADLGFQRVARSDIPPESVSVGGNSFKVTCSQGSMGTLVSVTGIHESSDAVQAAAGAAFAEMDRVVGLLNRYDPSSALSYLNTEGSIDGPPPELTEVMRQARYFRQASEGAFDSTVQPLVDLFRKSLGAIPGRTGPSEFQLLQALALVDGRKVEMGPGGIRFAMPGMGVTLDGIAKGYVVDRMTTVLRQEGLRNFLINAGGDIRGAGLREDGLPWQVGVQDPAKTGRLPDVIGLTDGAVATSGSYEIYFDRDRTYHHIVSSQTGGSPQTSQSVSVIAPTTLAADALATTVFVMGPERGVAFIESLPRCACLIVDRDGRLVRSQGWPSVTDPPTSKAGKP
jgi:thiamine biosynthesis lipoprotein